jgi:hypothetical protein
MLRWKMVVLAVFFALSYLNKFHLGHRSKGGGRSERTPVRAAILILVIIVVVSFNFTDFKAKISTNSTLI